MLISELKFFKPINLIKHFCIMIFGCVTLAYVFIKSMRHSYWKENTPKDKCSVEEHSKTSCFKG